MCNLFIKEKYLNELISILQKYCPNATVLAYGSRVCGDAHEGSDLDLAVKNLENSQSYLFELKEQLRESNIPFLIDVVEYDKVPDSFRKEIDKNFVVIYPVENEG